MADTWTDWEEPAAAAPPADTWVDYEPPKAAASQDTWVDWNPKPPPPEYEGTFAHVARKVAHNVIPTIAGIGTAVATMPATPWVAIPAGIGAFAATHAAQEAGLEYFGWGDAERQAANRQAAPITDIAAEAVSALIPFGVGPKLALGQRALGAAIGTGVEGVQQAVQGEFDPLRMAAAPVIGAVANQPRALTQAFGRDVQRVAGRVTGRPDWYGGAAAPPPLPGAPPEPPLPPAGTGGREAPFRRTWDPNVRPSPEPVSRETPYQPFERDPGQPLRGPAAPGGPETPFRPGGPQQPHGAPGPQAAAGVAEEQGQLARRVEGQRDYGKRPVPQEGGDGVEVLTPGQLDQAVGAALQAENAKVAGGMPSPVGGAPRVPPAAPVRPSMPAPAPGPAADFTPGRGPTPATRQRGPLQIQEGTNAAGQPAYRLMHGEETVGDFGNLGQAIIAMNRRANVHGIARPPEAAPTAAVPANMQGIARPPEAAPAAAPVTPVTSPTAKIPPVAPVRTKQEQATPAEPPGRAKLRDVQQRQILEDRLAANEATVAQMNKERFTATGATRKGFKPPGGMEAWNKQLDAAVDAVAQLKTALSQAPTAKAARAEPPGLERLRIRAEKVTAPAAPAAEAAPTKYELDQAEKARLYSGIQPKGKVAEALAARDVVKEAQAAARQEASTARLEAKIKVAEEAKAKAAAGMAEKPTLGVKPKPAAEQTAYEHGKRDAQLGHVARNLADTPEGRAYVEGAQAAGRQSSIQKTAPAGDDLGIPEFLRREPAAKPAATAGRKELTDVEHAALNKAEAEAFAKKYSGLEKMPSVPKDERELSTEQFMQKVERSEARYPHAALTRSRLNAAYEKARAESSKINDELIAAGRGKETGRDVRKQSDELSQRYTKNSDLVMSLADEKDRRMRWGGTLKPIPIEGRDTFAPGPRGDIKALQREDIMRRDVTGRGRSGRPITTEPLPIGTEPGIIKTATERMRGEPHPVDQAVEEFKKTATPEDWNSARQFLTDLGHTPKLDPDVYRDAIKTAFAAGWKPEVTEARLSTREIRTEPYIEAMARAPQPMPTPTGGGPAAPGTAQPTQPPTPPLSRASAKDLQEGVWPTIQRFFMPGSRSESGKAALAAYRESHGEMTHVRETALARITNDLHRADNDYLNMPEIDQRKLHNFAEGGAHLNTPGSAIHDPTYRPPPAMQRVVDAVKRGYDDYKTVLQNMPRHDQMNFIQDYLTHAYENKQAVSKFVSEWYGSPSGSLKARTHPTLEDAVAAGLTPKYGLVENFVRYSESMGTHISHQKGIDKVDSDGWLVWARPTTVGASGVETPLIKGAPPEGYYPLNMPWATRGGRQAYAPRDMAETFNNLYDAGLRRGETAKNLYEYALHTKNMWTAVELGMSAYHAFTVGGELIATTIARGNSQLASGDFKGAGKSYTEALIAPVKDYSVGRRWIDLYLGKKAGTPEEMQVVDAMKAANIKPVGLAHVQDYEMISKLGSYATSYMRGSLSKEMHAAAKEIFGGNYKKGALFIPEQVGRAMQTMMQPLFEFYIPAIKTAGLAKDLQAWLHLNPLASKTEINNVARRIADSMDNRFGEMVKDNLSMNKAFKDSAFLAMRSFAFTIGGPVREITGGALSGVRGALKGENRMSMTSKAYDPRVAYSIAFPLVTAGMAAIYNYARSGEWPKEWRDYVVPKTGGTIVSGRGEVEERGLLPGYHKDFLGYWFHPTQELWNKLAGPWQAFYEQIAGKNYRDQPILPPKPTWPEVFKYRGEALLERMTPISMQPFYEKNKPQPGSKITMGEQLIGFRAPGSYIQNPEGYQRAKERREFYDWRRKEKQINRDRLSRDLPPLQLKSATGTITMKKQLKSHSESDYRASTSNRKRCGTCNMYVDSKPPACTLVEKPIRPIMVCNYFEPKHKEAT